MTRLQAIRNFSDFLANEHVTIAHERYDNGNWSMDILNPTPRMYIPSDLDYSDEEDKAFREDFVNRCPCADDFADVTLTILHEFGHWFTRQAIDLMVYTEMVWDTDNYFSNPYEVLATQWAICWLLSPTNRQIAKDFENNYFGRT